MNDSSASSCEELKQKQHAGAKAKASTATSPEGLCLRSDTSNLSFFGKSTVCLFFFCCYFPPKYTSLRFFLIYKPYNMLYLKRMSIHQKNQVILEVFTSLKRNNQKNYPELPSSLREGNLLAVLSKYKTSGCYIPLQCDVRPSWQQRTTI